MLVSEAGRTIPRGEPVAVISTEAPVGAEWRNLNNEAGDLVDRRGGVEIPRLRAFGASLGMTPIPA